MNPKTIFFIVGAQRSGTSLLYLSLDSHPDICMARPATPEPKYFLRPPPSANVINDYFFRHYGHYKKEPVIGEKSTSYYESHTAASRIRETLPNARILFCLRHPVERAISNYFFSRQHGLEQRSATDVFLNNKPVPDFDKSKTSVSPFDYIARSDYPRVIQFFFNHFPERQIKILIFEELIASPTPYRSLLSFLGVDPGVAPLATNKAINPSAKEPLPPAIRQRLTEMMQPAIRGTESILGRRIPAWRS